MKYTTTFYLTLLSISCSFGQLVHINAGVDTLDVEVQKAIQFYRQYVNEFKGFTIPDDFGKYWSTEDCNNFKIPDPIVYALNGNYPTYALASSKTIFYIKPKKGYIHLKGLYGWIDSTNISLFCIANHYIRFDDNKHPEFINPLELNTKNWGKTTIRNVTFFYPPNHTFDQAKADSLIVSIKNLENGWDLHPIEIKYYLADTREEIEQIKGLDFSLLTGNRDKPSGIADERNNIVYCAGLGENYFHEVVHIYLKSLFPDSPLKEGLAVFYGGSMGNSLEWHLQRLNAYLNQHPEIDLNELDDFWYMDNYTNPNSTIKGMLCQMIFERDKIEGLRRIMTYKTIEEIFLKEFNIEEGKWDKFLRSRIEDK